jgi:hypothetical protein
MSLIDPDVSNFIHFMKRHFRKREDTHKNITHTLIGPLHKTYANYRGAFCIEGPDYDIFINLYKKAFFKMDMHIVERQVDVGPMLIDIDIKTDEKHNDRQYKNHHIEYIIEIYTKLFEMYLNIDSKNLKAFVFEKPTPTYDEKSKIYKDGFHIVYPYVSINSNKRYFFFNRAKEIIIDENVFMNKQFINTYDDILDSSVVARNGFLMYGSHKENKSPYLLTKIYNHDMSLYFFDHYNHDRLIDILSLTQYSKDDDIHFKKSFEYLNDNIKKTDVKHDIICLTYDNYDIEIAQKLTNILSTHRSTIYSDWINVGFALYNISDQLLDSFLEFSKKAKNYDKYGCEQLWKNIKKNPNGFTLKSLHHWAKCDNHEEYLKIINDFS